MRIKRFLSFLVSGYFVLFFINLIPMSINAIPSSYWCQTDKKTGCTHCLSHTSQTVGTAVANCTQGGGSIVVCTFSNCGKVFYQTAPLNHLYNTSGEAQKMCKRSTTCGFLKGNTSGTFQHYMYRTSSISGTNRANFITAFPSASHHSNNKGIDITADEEGAINGYSIYAQGNGTVSAKGGSNTADTGYYVQITYNNGWHVRYLHLKQSSVLSLNATVTEMSLIGATGNSGTNVTGYHLHQDIKPNGTTFSNANNFYPSGTFTS
ncbi:MAG: M23 family metallopeptidase [Oscillospiraceae bacterium]|jgi:hypothetical protein|nr:M23 family metallopeptidase [Oscillospiraceae bacterium]